MAGTEQLDEPRLGFLTAMEIENRGYVGGLLVTNCYARPLEFQCTRPIQPNRTQEILYGPTLVPFLLGSLIGRTLVEKVTAGPHLILTDRQEMLELRRHIAVPVGCLSEESASVKLGRQHVACHQDFPDDPQQMEHNAAAIPRDADLAEPMERVRSALQESLSAGAA